MNAKSKISYNYDIASLRSYINRAITICFIQKLLEGELETIGSTAIKNDFKKEIVQKLYR